jgi:hypothetical protein
VGALGYPGQPDAVDACFGDQVEGGFEDTVPAALPVLCAGRPATARRRRGYSWCGQQRSEHSAAAEGRVLPDLVEYNALPWKYAAGTPNILGAIVSAQALRLLLDLALTPRGRGSRHQCWQPPGSGTPVPPPACPAPGPVAAAGGIGMTTPASAFSTGSVIRYGLRDMYRRQKKC